MITEDYVSFEVAKLLKERGFDENTPVNYFVGDDKLRGCMVGEMIYHKRAEEDTHLIACPTIQTAMKWLMKVHKLCVVVKPYVTEEGIFYLFEIKEMNKDCVINKKTKTGFDTYEEACEEAIRYCLQKLI